MPAKRGKDEQVFIRRFVSAYENFAWAGSKIDRLDEETDGAVEALITRADGRTIAIEHTLIEPFVGDKRDYAMFNRAFAGIEGDGSLTIPDTAIIVYVPVGIFDGRKSKREEIVESIHVWISGNRLHLREGKHEYHAELAKMLQVKLTVSRTRLGSLPPKPGSVLVRRQQVVNDLDKVIERALRTKLPKLVNTDANRHLLFLERDQFSFHPDLIFAEIERQRSSFPDLDKVDEIWHVETISYANDGYLYFELRKRSGLLATLDFLGDQLIGHSKDGLPYPL